MDPGSVPPPPPPSSPPPPLTTDDIFDDYRNRRAGIIRALVEDVDLFYASCDPEKESLGLYGLPDRTWKVSEPPRDVPAELPEPTLGINFPRDLLVRRNWLRLIAVNCDWWLLAVAYYQAVCFNRDERRRLLNMINDLPTVYEVVTERERAKDRAERERAERERAKDRAGVDSESKPKPPKKRSSEGQIKYKPADPVQQELGQDEDSESKPKPPKKRSSEGQIKYKPADPVQQELGQDEGSESKPKPPKKRSSEGQIKYKPADPVQQELGQDEGSESKPKPPKKRSSEGQIKYKPADPVKQELGQDEDSGNLCGVCGRNGSENMFWILCDICERWFHGHCVKVTSAMAESIGLYKCPSCRSKKAKQ